MSAERQRHGQLAPDPLNEADPNGIPWVVLGGPDYAVQIRHPDGGHLRISWDGTITPRAAPPEVSPQRKGTAWGQ